jgi:murein tripeptide amidase MpaA
MAYPSTVREIEDALGALASAHPALCTRTTLPNATHEGRRVSAVRVTNGGSRAVLFIGGAHAREWAPPDALLTLLQRLIAAYEGQTALTIPAFTDTASTPDLAYPAASIAAADVKRIVERVELHVVACINPDGRAFTQSGPANAMWRKNRRPPQPGSTCRGVDCNRNNDVAWDYERYYSPSGAANNSASTDPCDFQVYVGPAAVSEPEVRNVAGLMRDQDIGWFVDVHSFSRKLLYPWGMDGNQSRDPSQNYLNPAWDGRRDGTTGGPYGEYIEAEALASHVRIGNAMRDAILAATGTDRRARVRSEYSVEPSLALYPTTGTFSDFAYTLREDGSIVSFTLECGSDADGEGGFQPVPAIYPKIEREVQLALLAMLLEAAA